MEFLTGYTNFSVNRSGVLPIVGPRTGVQFEVDRDLRPLFPYLNTELPEAKYFADPERIQCVFEQALCTIYSKEVIAAGFHDEDSARCFADRFVEYLNEVHEKQGTLKPDYTTVEHFVPMDIYQLLPKTNCGKCGQESCFAFAALLSKGRAASCECPGFSDPIAQKAVYPIFDKHGNLSSTIELSIPEQDKQTAVSEDLLTKREVEVLRLLAKGLSNPAIAATLSISQHTVKSHVTHIYDKLGVNDRAQAAVWASRHKVI
ncbi:MAG: hypothetical protein D3925_10155 [Candidatus Electrothrix sp. AR5]|nr:hypothetical protein [Candidatus Electrothrix sp. AR5]